MTVTPMTPTMMELTKTHLQQRKQGTAQLNQRYHA